MAPQGLVADANLVSGLGQRQAAGEGMARLGRLAGAAQMPSTLGVIGSAQQSMILSRWSADIVARNAVRQALTPIAPLSRYVSGAGEVSGNLEFQQPARFGTMPTEAVGETPQEASAAASPFGTSSFAAFRERIMQSRAENGESSGPEAPGSVAASSMPSQSEISAALARATEVAPAPPPRMGPAIQQRRRIEEVPRSAIQGGPAATPSDVGSPAPVRDASPAAPAEIRRTVDAPAAPPAQQSIATPAVERVVEAPELQGEPAVKAPTAAAESVQSNPPADAAPGVVEEGPSSRLDALAAQVLQRAEAAREAATANEDEVAAPPAAARAAQQDIPGAGAAASGAPIQRRTEPPTAARPVTRAGPSAPPVAPSGTTRAPGVPPSAGAASGPTAGRNEPAIARNPAPAPGAARPDGQPPTEAVQRAPAATTPPVADVEAVSEEPAPQSASVEQAVASSETADATFVAAQASDVERVLREATQPPTGADAVASPSGTAPVEAGQTRPISPDAPIQRRAEPPPTAPQAPISAARAEFRPPQAAETAAEAVLRAVSTAAEGPTDSPAGNVPSTPATPSETAPSGLVLREPATETRPAPGLAGEPATVRNDASASASGASEAAGPAATPPAASVARTVASAPQTPSTPGGETVTPETSVAEAIERSATHALDAATRSAAQSGQAPAPTVTGNAGAVQRATQPSSTSANPAPPQGSSSLTARAESGGQANPAGGAAQAPRPGAGEPFVQRTTAPAGSTASAPGGPTDGESTLAAIAIAEGGPVAQVGRTDAPLEMPLREDNGPVQRSADDASTEASGAGTMLSPTTLPETSPADEVALHQATAPMPPAEQGVSRVFDAVEENDLAPIPEPPTSPNLARSVSTNDGQPAAADAAAQSALQRATAPGATTGTPRPASVTGPATGEPPRSPVPGAPVASGRAADGGTATGSRADSHPPVQRTVEGSHSSAVTPAGSPALASGPGGPDAGNPAFVPTTSADAEVQRRLAEATAPLPSASASGQSVSSQREQLLSSLTAAAATSAARPTTTANVARRVTANLPSSAPVNQAAEAPGAVRRMPAAPASMPLASDADVPGGPFASASESFATSFDASANVLARSTSSSSLPLPARPATAAEMPLAPIQRALPSSGGNQQVTQSVETEGKPAEEPMDFEKIAEKVWPRIRQKIRIERERERGLPS